jgi:hypothetical protein
VVEQAGSCAGRRQKQVHPGPSNRCINDAYRGSRGGIANGTDTGTRARRARFAALSSPTALCLQAAVSGHLWPPFVPRRLATGAVQVNDGVGTGEWVR